MASPQMSAVISQTDFAGLNLRARGKVRDIYELGDQLADRRHRSAVGFRRSTSHADSRIRAEYSHNYRFSGSISSQASCRIM